MREDIGMKSRGMGVSGDEFEWFWVVCRERKCGGKRKWVSQEDAYEDVYETMGGMDGGRNELMGIREVIGVGFKVLEYEDVGIEVMDMGEYEDQKGWI